MYNYYIFEKQQQDLAKKKKEEESRKNWQKLQEKRMPKLMKNYEERIKNFIYQMAENPIKLRENKYTSTTTREDLYKEEAGKILSKKGFVFSPYRPDLDKKFDYDSDDKSSKYNDSVPENNKITEKKYKILQPIMRFKPRTDLERVYDTIMYNGPPEHKPPKYVIENQLKSLGLKSVKVRKSPRDEGEPEEEEYDDDNDGFDPAYYEATITSQPNQTARQKSRTATNYGKNIINNKELYNEGQQKVKPKKKVQSHILKTKKEIKGRVDNSNARRLYPELYNKTYFKALENYPLFGNSCLLPRSFKDRSETFTSMNFSPKTKKRSKERVTIQSQPINQVIDTTYPVDFINIFSQFKNNKESNILSSLDNIDLFTQEIEKKTNQKRESSIDNEKLKELKKLAFAPTQEQLHEEFHYNYQKKYEKEIGTDYKPEDKIIIDGVEYLRSDYEGITKKVLRKCNWTKKPRYVDSFKPGTGKVMCTNGMSINDFERKYHLSG